MNNNHLYKKKKYKKMHVMKTDKSSIMLSILESDEHSKTICTGTF